jgi:hypothetical protein
MTAALRPSARASASRFATEGAVDAAAAVLGQCRGATEQHDRRIRQIDEVAPADRFGAASTYAKYPRFWTLLSVIASRTLKKRATSSGMS